MLRHFSLCTALSLATCALAQTLASCDGNMEPDWDDCDMIEQLFDAQPGFFPNYYPGCAYAAAPAGVDADSLNCRISICPNSASYQVSKADASVGYTTVSTDCKPANAGGVFQHSEDYYLQVSNNPDYVPPSKRRGLEAQRRSHPRELITRQESGDNGYTLAVKQVHVERPGTEQAVTGNLPAGSSYTTESSTQKTTGITSSVEAGGGFFDIFEASVSISVSRDYTVSSTTGVTVNVDCESGQEGMIYWYPTFTAYKGYYTPSQDEVDWYIPDTQGGANYRVRCTG